LHTAADGLICQKFKKIRLQEKSVVSAVQLLQDFMHVTSRMFYDFCALLQWKGFG